MQNVNAFNSINEAAKILVPGALYNEWKKATNWTTYADYIEAVGEIPTQYSEGLDLSVWSGEAAVNGIGTCTDDIIVIPKEYQGFPVTRITNIESGTFKQIIMPDTIKYIDLGICDCANLERVEFGSDLEGINYWCFNNNPKCKEYNFTRCKRVPWLYFYFDEYTEGYAFEGMPSDCKMIVPGALVDEWKQATNWTIYADHIVAG